MKEMSNLLTKLNVKMNQFCHIISYSVIFWQNKLYFSKSHWLDKRRLYIVCQCVTYDFADTTDQILLKLDAWCSLITVYLKYHTDWTKEGTTFPRQHKGSHLLLISPEGAASFVTHETFTVALFFNGNSKILESVLEMQGSFWGEKASI